MVNPVCSISSSSRRECNHITCEVVPDNAMYSASMVDSATVGCFFEYQDMAALPNMTANLEMDFQSVELIPQLASE